MEDFAVIRTKGKQYIVHPGEEFEMDVVLDKEGKKVTIDEVLLVSKKGKCEIGQPVLKNEKVVLQIIEEKQGEKITTSKFKAKSRYRKKTGSRNTFSKVKVVSI